MRLSREFYTQRRKSDSINLLPVRLYDCKIGLPYNVSQQLDWLLQKDDFVVFSKGPKIFVDVL